MEADPFADLIAAFPINTGESQDPEENDTTIKESQAINPQLNEPEHIARKESRDDSGGQAKEAIESEMGEAIQSEETLESKTEKTSQSQDDALADSFLIVSPPDQAALTTLSPASTDKRIQELEMQVNMLMTQVNQQKDELKGREALHEKEIADLKDRFRNLSARQKEKYLEMKTKLQNAVSKGRDFAERNRELVARLRQADQSRNQLLNEKEEYVKQVETARAREAELLAEQTRNMERMQEALREQAGEKEQMSHVLESVLTEMNEKQDLIDQIVQEQKAMQQMRCSIFGEPMNCKPLKCQVVGVDRGVRFQWHRSVNARYVPIEGATGETYFPNSDDIGTMIKVEVQSLQNAGSKSSCEVGPVQLDQADEVKLHTFMKDMRQPNNNIFYPLQEENKSVYIVLNGEKIKIKDEKRKTIEKEVWNDSMKIILSDENPRQFSLQLSSRSPVHQFLARQQKDRELICLLIRTMYMRNLTVNMDQQRLYLRCLISASAQKERFAFVPANFMDSPERDALLMQRLNEISSFRVRENSVSTTYNDRPHKSPDLVSPDMMGDMNSDVFGVTPRTQANNTDVSDRKASADPFDLGMFDDPPLQSSQESDREGVETDSEMDFGEEEKDPTKDPAKNAMTDLEILDKPVTQTTDGELASIVSSFGLPMASSKKKGKAIQPPAVKKKKKKKRKRAEKASVHMILSESWKVKLENLSPVELACTGTVKLLLEPSPAAPFDYPLQLQGVDHIKNISCNPQFVDDVGDHKYTVHVDAGTQELAAVMYAMHPHVANQVLPIKAKCSWEFQNEYSKVVIHLKTNPAMQLTLKDLSFKFTLGAGQHQLVDAKPDPSQCSLVENVVTWSLGEVEPSNDSVALTTVLRHTEPVTDPIPVFLTFRADGHFSDQLVVAAEQNDSFQVGNTTKTSEVEYFQVD